MKPITVGVIGLGAIGSRLVGILAKEFSNEARVGFLCDLHKERVREMRRKWVPKARSVSWSSLVDQSDLIIEAASQAIALPVAKRALAQNKQVLVLSVGGLLQWNGLSSKKGDRLAVPNQPVPFFSQTKGRLWIPSGALAGVDALLAANEGRLRRVTLTTRKPVAGLAGAPYFRRKKIRLSAIKGPTVVFEGSAAEAVRAFPKNVNVAATLALAGIGPEKTRVRIVASPTYRRNRHKVEMEGDFGVVRTEVENRPSAANPRTSELAVLSAAATLKKIFGRVSIGT